MSAGRLLDALRLRRSARSRSGQLRLNAMSGAVGTVVAACTLVVSYPVYLHFLGYEKLGVWVAMTTVLSVAQLANLGIGSAVTKLVAEEFGLNDREGVRRYVAMATQILCASGLLVFLAVLLLRNEIVGLFALHGSDAALARMILPYVGLITIYYFLVDIAVSVLTGLGRMDIGIYARAGGLLLDLGLSISLLACGWGVISLLISDAVALTVVHVSCIVLARTVVGFNPFAVRGWDRRRLSSLMRFGGGVFGNALLSILIAPLNKVALSRFVGVESLPVYEIALKGTGMLRSLAESPLRAIMPEISRIWSTRSATAARQVAQIYRRSLTAIVCLALPAYALVFFCDRPLLHLWLRHRYSDAVPAVFNILLLASMIGAAGMPAYFALLGAGRVRVCFVTHVIGAIVNMSWLAWLASTATVSMTAVAWGSVLFFVTTDLFLLWKAQAAFGELSASAVPDAVAVVQPAV